MQALGKVSFFIFSGEFFAEGLDHSPRQRAEGYGQGPRQRPEKF